MRAMPKRTEAGLPVLRMRPVPKGRTLEMDALDEVRALLGDAPRRRDLLIEHLHRLQDHYGHLSDRHLLALANEMDMAAAGYPVPENPEFWIAAHTRSRPSLTAPSANPTTEKEGIPSPRFTSTRTR